MSSLVDIEHLSNRLNNKKRIDRMLTETIRLKYRIVYCAFRFILAPYLIIHFRQ